MFGGHETLPTASAMDFSSLSCLAVHEDESVINSCTASSGNFFGDSSSPSWDNLSLVQNDPVQLPLGGETTNSPKCFVSTLSERVFREPPKFP